MTRVVASSNTVMKNEYASKLDISQRTCPRDVENMLAIFPISRLAVRSATSGAASLAWEYHVDKQHCKIEYHSTERTFSFKFQERRSSAKIHHLCRVNANSSNCSLEVSCQVSSYCCLSLLRYLVTAVTWPGMWHGHRAIGGSYLPL